ncbi:MAG TPA: ArsA family ATPase [Terriglobales bacterium]|nr:ArsA family ATPase [Terriglobales bacterium]
MSTHLTFFLGKGGVGKTTVSTAYALQASAKRGRKVILISTDPAHSLADVLNVKLKSGMQTLRKSGAGKLSVWQVEAGSRFKEFLDQYRDAITDLVEQGTFLSRNEIESLLETTLPGLAEVSALLTISDLLDSGKFDEIVVDTAPIGHTLQLFRIPTQLARFLEFLELSGRRDQVLAEHFGGSAAAAQPRVLDEWNALLASLRAALSTEQSRLVMVTSAERFSLEEASRTAQMLEEDADARIATVVLNRVVTNKSACKRCQERFRLYGSARHFVAHRFPEAELRVGEDPGAPLIGVQNLTAFGQHVFADKHLRLNKRHPKHAREVTFRSSAWPITKTQLTLTLGKGGVGKTTISGGLAFTHRRQHPKENILICSTDPAPSLDDLFEQNVGATPRPVLGDKRFQAVEVDSTAEYLAWSRKVKRVIAQSLEIQQGGLHVELSFEHEMLSALLDIVPPGVDEIFAVFKLLDFIESRNLTLVIDMAPTGHALELLRTPQRLVVWTRLLLKSLSAHSKLPLAQELAVEVASISQRARDLAALLKDRKRASVFVAMLAEPLPDRQTGRLLSSLKDLGLRPSAIFVNRILPSQTNAKCPRCSLAREWQLATLSEIKSSALRCYAVPDFSGQIAGASGLKRLTKQLWEIESS